MQASFRLDVNVFLTPFRSSLTNVVPKFGSSFDQFMSEFIIMGIIVILGVNGFYSRFCEADRGSSSATSGHISRSRTQMR
jgi:hypothetical protein